MLGRRDLWHIIREVNDVSVLMFFPGSFLVKNDGESFLWRYSPPPRSPLPSFRVDVSPKEDSNAILVTCVNSPIFQ